MSDEVVDKPATTEAEDKAAWFADLKAKFGPSAPDEATVEAWKKQCGRVRVVSFGPDELYFFRALRSAEYKGMISQVITIKDVQQQNELLKEKMVAMSVLWPKLDQTEMGALFAGTKDSLHLMIMQASNFITPDEAEVMVREL
jgi:hypothetical protein